MKFGEILQELLDEANMTQKELATALNLGATSLGNYIRGIRQPDFDTLKSIAAYYNVSTDYLLDFHGDGSIDHNESELLRLYRNLSEEEKKLYLEQGKTLYRLNHLNKTESSKQKTKD